MQPDLATSLPALSLDELQPATAASTHASNVVVPAPLRSLIDAGDVRGIEALGDVDFRQPYDDFRTPTLLHRALDLGHERLCAHMLRAGGENLARAPGLHSATLAHVAAHRRAKLVGVLPPSAKLAGLHLAAAFLGPARRPWSFAGPRAGIFKIV